MRPFTPREVTNYLLWVILALALVGILGWYIFQSRGHDRLPTTREGSTAQIHSTSGASLPGA
jgi:hypothetical protein